MRERAIGFKLFVFFFFLVTAIFSQVAIDQDKYYYGSGISQNLQEARANALSDISSQIAVNVQNVFENRIEEGGGSLKEKVTSVLKTYSIARLKDVQFNVKERGDGQFEVFAYIEKTKVQKIFEERKNLIAQLARQALKYEDRGNLSFALKLNYFALILMNSLPDETVQDDSVNYTIAIPARINQILTGVQFKLVENRFDPSRKERTITLRVTYKDRPVSLLHFSFWDGQNYIPVQARDGIATAKLYGSATSVNNLKAMIEYQFYDSRKEMNVVNELWQLVKKPLFFNRRTISLNKPQLANGTKVQIQSAARKNAIAVAGDVPQKLVRSILDEAKKFVEVLKANDLQKINQVYGNDEFLKNKLSRYLIYNRPQPMDDSSDVHINKTRTGYELRRIRVLQQYTTLHQFNTEYLVLDFDNQGKLVDFNTSVSQSMYQHLVEQSKHGADWQDLQEIMKFVEKYRMAYLTRDLHTIDLMFAEDALIIVGRKVKKTRLPRDLVTYQRFGEQPDYEYLRRTKEEYLANLKNIFNVQDDIFLNFGSIDIISQQRVREVYGVEMRQSYYSTTYADEGYLFLLVDFSEQDPIIHVRAWQPNTWKDEALIRTGNFKIYR